MLQTLNNSISNSDFDTGDLVEFYDGFIWLQAGTANFFGLHAEHTRVVL